MAERSDQLRLAVAKGEVSLVKALLSQGFTADLDKDGRNLLHIAAQNGHLELVKTLVDRGFDTGSQDASGYTPLHRASAQGHLEVIEFLLDSGCPIDQKDEYGNTALHVASWNGFSQTVALLLRKKANINASNKAGFTALHSAGQKGHNQSARVLLYAACRMNAKNKYGDAPLHTSTQYGHAGVVRILLSAKCKVNIQNKNGETALHKAVMNKRYKIAKILIEAGVEKKLKNKLGETALDISRKLNDNEMILTITSEEKPKKLPFMLRRQRSSTIRQSFHTGDASSASDISKKKKSNSQSQQELSARNSSPAPTYAASHTDAVFTRSQSSTVVELNRCQSNRQSHATIRSDVNRLSQDEMLKSKVKTFAEVEGVIAGADSSRRLPSPLLPPPPPSHPKPGHIFYRDLSGKLKQGPVGCIRADRSFSSTRHRETNKTYEDFYEPLTQTKKLSSVEIEPSCKRFSDLGNRHNQNASNLKSEETRIQGRKLTAKPEPPRDCSRSRLTDIDQQKCSRCSTYQRLAGSCDSRHSNVPTASGNLGNCPEAYLRYIVDGERKSGANTYRDQPVRSLSDETISERRQRQSNNCHGHVMQIPNADDGDSSDESTCDWMTANAPRCTRDRKCETINWHQMHASSSLGRRVRQRRPYHKNDLCHQDLRDCYVSPSRTSGNRRISERRNYETSKTFKENLNSSAIESFRSHNDNVQCQQLEREISGPLRQRCRDVSLFSADDCPLAHVQSKEHVSVASGMQSVTCDCGVSCPNESDNQSFCANCLHKNTSSLRRADTGSNPDSGYGSKIYHSKNDCIAYSQRPVEVKSKNRDRNSLLSESKEFFDLSAHDYSKNSKIFADDRKFNKDRIKQTSGHVCTDYKITSVDVHHQPNCSLLTVDNVNTTIMREQRLLDAGSDLSVVSERSDSQREQCGHFDFEDFDKHKTLATSKTFAVKSIDIDTPNSLKLGKKLEENRTSYESTDVASNSAVCFTNAPCNIGLSNDVHFRKIGRSTTV